MPEVVDILDFTGPPKPELVVYSEGLTTDSPGTTAAERHEWTDFFWTSLRYPETIDGRFEDDQIQNHTDTTDRPRVELGRTKTEGFAVGSSNDTTTSPSVEPTDQTDFDTHSDFLVLLHELVATGSQKEFIEAVENVDWRTKTPREAKQTIDLALELGCHSVASELAAKGHKMFRHDHKLERLACVLAPPKLIRKEVPAVKGLNASVKWFEEHRKQYSGNWLVVRNGELLVSANSREELSKALDQLDTRSDVLVAFAR